MFRFSFNVRNVVTTICHEAEVRIDERGTRHSIVFGMNIEYVRKGIWLRLCQSQSVQTTVYATFPYSTTLASVLAWTYRW